MCASGGWLVTASSGGSAERRVPPERLQHFVAAVARAEGVPGDQAETFAARMIEADLRGMHGHGVVRLAPYVRRMREGGYTLRPKIRALRETPVSALVEGDNGLGQVVMTFAVETAIAKARASGLAWVGVRGGNQAGAGGVYAALALPHDLAGRVDGGAGRACVDGFAAGGGGAVAAGGGAQGVGPEHDGGDAGGGDERSGVRQRRDRLQRRLHVGDEYGQAYLALRPDLFRDLPEFKAEMDLRLRELRASRPAPGEGAVRVPGEMAAAREAEMRAQGIPVAAGGHLRDAHDRGDGRDDRASFGRGPDGDDGLAGGRSTGACRRVRAGRSHRRRRRRDGRGGRR